MGLKLGGECVVLLAEPKLCRQVLIDQANIFIKVCVKLHACHIICISHALAESDLSHEHIGT